MAAPKQVIVHKSPAASTGTPTTHSTADSFFINGNGDLIVIDQALAVVAAYPKGTWGTVRTGMNV